MARDSIIATHPSVNATNLEDHDKNDLLDSVLANLDKNTMTKSESQKKRKKEKQKNKLEVSAPTVNGGAHIEVGNVESSIHADASAPKAKHNKKKRKASVLHADDEDGERADGRVVHDELPTLSSKKSKKKQKLSSQAEGTVTVDKPRKVTLTKGDREKLEKEANAALVPMKDAVQNSSSGKGVPDTFIHDDIGTQVEGHGSQGVGALLDGDEDPTGEMTGLLKNPKQKMSKKQLKHLRKHQEEAARRLESEVEDSMLVVEITGPHDLANAEAQRSEVQVHESKEKSEKHGKGPVPLHADDSIMGYAGDDEVEVQTKSEKSKEDKKNKKSKKSKKDKEIVTEQDATEPSQQMPHGEAKGNFTQYMPVGIGARGFTKSFVPSADVATIEMTKSKKETALANIPVPAPLPGISSSSEDSGVRDVHIKQEPSTFKVPEKILDANIIRQETMLSQRDALRETVFRAKNGSAFSPTVSSSRRNLQANTSMPEHKPTSQGSSKMTYTSPHQKESPIPPPRPRATSNFSIPPPDFKRPFKASRHSFNENEPLSKVVGRLRKNSFGPVPSIMGHMEDGRRVVTSTNEFDLGAEKLLLVEEPTWEQRAGKVRARIGGDDAEGEENIAFSSTYIAAHPEGIRVGNTLLSRLVPIQPRLAYTFPLIPVEEKETRYCTIVSGQGAVITIGPKGEVTKKRFSMRVGGMWVLKAGMSCVVQNATAEVVSLNVWSFKEE